MHFANSKEQCINDIHSNFAISTFRNDSTCIYKTARKKHMWYLPQLYTLDIGLLKRHHTGTNLNACTQFFFTPSTATTNSFCVLIPQVSWSLSTNMAISDTTLFHNNPDPGTRFINEINCQHYRCHHPLWI